MNNKIIDTISILIVEDEEELRDYLQEYLQLFFKNVYIATCGEDGYKKYLEIKPEIILCDINMPNLDGLSMIKRIRQNDIDTNIIIMSAHSEQDKLLKAIELKLTTYLIKPINSQELKEILFNILNTIENSNDKIYLSEDIFWNKTSLTLQNNSTQIDLNDKEVMLFQLLCSKPNNTFNSKEIFDYLYRDRFNKKFSEYSITSLLKRVRSKLPHDVIKNEYGAGYKVSVQV